MFLLFSLFAPFVALADGRACCAYNGKGGMTALGQGIFPSNGSKVTPFLVGVNPLLGSAVYVDPTQPDPLNAPVAPIGWMLLTNRSAVHGQSLYAWSPLGCTQNHMGPFSPENACFGTVDSAFPYPQPSISFGGVPANVWSNEHNFTTAIVLEANCAIVSIWGTANPTGLNGAWSFTVVNGAGAAPNDSWFKPPAQCK